MNIDRPIILALFAAASYIPTAIAGESVVIAAQETEAFVAPRAARLRVIDLPALDFGLRAAFTCKGQAESLTLSIADSFTTLDAEALTDQRAAAAALTVPASQVALAASSTFCLEDDPASADLLLVPALTTAHASLRCSNDDGATVHFTSTPLQVRLRCNRPSADDQESSPAK
jgi:hypothetical protein